MKQQPVRRLWSLLALTYLLSPGLALATEAFLKVPVQLKIEIMVEGLMLGGSPPDGVGISSSATRDSVFDADATILRLAKVEGLPGTYRVSILLPERSSRDFGFEILLERDSKWHPEPFSFGMRHVIVLDGEETAQECRIRYDAKGRRFESISEGVTVADDHTAAAKVANARGDLAGERRYLYDRALFLLRQRSYREAKAAYGSYLETLPSGSSREEYDRFYVHYARSLAASGNLTEGINELRSRPVPEGGPEYQGEIQLALAALVARAGDTIEERAMLRGLSETTDVPAVNAKSSFRLANSLVEESDPDTSKRGRDMLFSIGKSSGQYRREAMRVLARIYHREGNFSEARELLQDALEIGDTNDRTEVGIQLTELDLEAMNFQSAATRVEALRANGAAERALPQLLFQHIRALEGLGMRAESASLRSELIERFPNNPFAIRAAMDVSNSTSTLPIPGSSQNERTLP